MNVYVPDRTWQQLLAVAEAEDRPVDLCLAAALAAYLDRAARAVAHTHRLEDGCQWDGFVWLCEVTR